MPQQAVHRFAPTLPPLPHRKFLYSLLLMADFAVCPFALIWHQQQKNAVDKLSVRFCPYTNGSIILPHYCPRTWCNRFAHAQYRIISLLDFGLTCEDSYLRQSNPAHCHCRLVWCHLRIHKTKLRRQWTYSWGKLKRLNRKELASIVPPPGTPTARLAYGFLSLRFTVWGYDWLLQSLKHNGWW